MTDLIQSLRDAIADMHQHHDQTPMEIVVYPDALFLLFGLDFKKVYRLPALNGHILAVSETFCGVLEKEVVTPASKGALNQLYGIDIRKLKFDG